MAIESVCIVQSNRHLPFKRTILGEQPVWSRYLKHERCARISDHSLSISASAGNGDCDTYNTGVFRLQHATARVEACLPTGGGSTVDDEWLRLYFRCEGRLHHPAPRCGRWANRSTGKIVHGVELCQKRKIKRIVHPVGGSLSITWSRLEPLPHILLWARKK